MLLGRPQSRGTERPWGGGGGREAGCRQCLNLAPTQQQPLQHCLQTSTRRLKQSYHHSCLAKEPAPTYPNLPCAARQPNDLHATCTNQLQRSHGPHNTQTTMQAQHQNGHVRLAHDCAHYHIGRPQWAIALQQKGQAGSKARSDATLHAARPPGLQGCAQRSPAPLPAPSPRARQNPPPPTPLAPATGRGVWTFAPIPMPLARPHLSPYSKRHHAGLVLWQAI